MQNNNNPAKKENKWLADRSTGIFILVLSIGAAMISIVWPVMGMFKQSEDVIFSTNMIIINLVGLLFGLTYTILGGETLNKLSNPAGKKEVTRSIVFAVIFLAVLVGLVQIWSTLVSTLGYG